MAQRGSGMMTLTLEDVDRPTMDKAGKEGKRVT